MSKKEIQEEIKNLTVLLRMEKEEDLALYKRKMSGTSVSERREQGVCWYPVNLEKTNFDAGARLLIKISRPPEHKQSHLFQSGKLISIFSNAGTNHENSEMCNGVVNQVNEHSMLITLNNDKIPEWIHDSYLGVQLLFDENAYREMENALRLLLKTKDEHIDRLKNILLGAAQATFRSSSPSETSILNQGQNLAVSTIYNANELAIVHGPPGTGKTTTLVQAITTVAQQESQVLVCAPSNAAVDLLVEKLDEQGLAVVRIGHPARVTENILNHTLDAHIAHHNDYRDLKSLKKKSEEFRRLGNKYKRHFGSAEREQRKHLFAESRRLKEEAEHLEYYIINSILSNATVIASTLVGANNTNLKGMRFKTVFIDEAAQALEPACWIPILKSERVIFAGDHCQLPPTIKSFKAAKNGLDITLFQKAVNRNQGSIMLTEQYRMHRKIMDFSNGMFYSGRLFPNKKVANWQLLDDDLPMEFVDTAGTGFSEQINSETKSSYNQEEAHLLLQHLKTYLDKLYNAKSDITTPSIGIISPYKAQAGYLKDTFEKSFDKEDTLTSDVSINTIDSFQGQERDIIYISLVRSNSRGEIGFLADTRRMNVALTRAKKKLVIIGDSATIGQHDFYTRLLDYINEIDAYRSAFEFQY